MGPVVPGGCDTVRTGSGVRGVHDAVGWGRLSPGSVTAGSGPTAAVSLPEAVTQQGQGQMSPEAVTPQRGPGWGQCRVSRGAGDTAEGMGTNLPADAAGRPGTLTPSPAQCHPSSLPAGDAAAGGRGFDPARSPLSRN